MYNDNKKLLVDNNKINKRILQSEDKGTTTWDREVWWSYHRFLFLFCEPPIGIIQQDIFLFSVSFVLKDDLLNFLLLFFFLSVFFLLCFYVCSLQIDLSFCEANILLKRWFLPNCTELMEIRTLFKLISYNILQNIALVYCY